MGKDQRLYSKFAIDFHRHPKVDRLTDKAFRTFVEMVGEARIADNDGVFQAEDAEFMWDVDVLAQLVRSHPTRPLVIHEGGTYRIRDYDKHQQTRAEREELARVARENGAKGGRPRKPRRNPGITQGVSEINQPEPSGTQTKAESESELEIDDFRTSSQSGLVSNAREILDRIDPKKIRAELKSLAVEVTDEELADWAEATLALSPSPVRNPTGYLMTAIRTDANNDGGEIEGWLHNHRRSRIKAVWE